VSDSRNVRFGAIAKVAPIWKVAKMSEKQGSNEMVLANKTVDEVSTLCTVFFEER
jgi:hypothetical protein